MSAEESFQIFIKAGVRGVFRGPSAITLDVERADSIFRVKERILVKTNILIGKQRLMYQGKQLDDESTVGNCGIGKEASLYLFLVVDAKYPITVKDSAGKAYEMMMNSSDTIRSVMFQIHSQGGPPVFEQRIIYAGKQLEEYQSLSDYNVPPASVLHVVHRQRPLIPLFVIGPGSERNSFEPAASDTIARLKQLISERLGIATAEQELRYRGRLFDDESMIHDCSLEANCEIVLTRVAPARRETRISVTVHNRFSNERRVVEVDVSWNFGLLKTHIESLFGIPPSNQVLSLRGTALEAGRLRTLADTGIEDGATIDLIQNLALSLTPLRGEEHHVNVGSSDDTVAQAKTRIRDELKLDYDIDLLFDGRVLDNGANLRSYGINGTSNESRIEILPRQSGVISAIEKLTRELDSVRRTLALQEAEALSMFGIPAHDVVIPPGAQRLGKGALGEVFPATYCGVPVAIKRLFALQPDSEYPELTPDEEASVRSELRRECQMLARLRCPFLVSYYGFTVREGAAAGSDVGLDWVVMERLEGVPARLNPADAQLAVRCVALALQYLHEHSIIHRDVKPSNILYDRKNAIFKLSDLGEAKVKRLGATQRSVRGTPLYMAPEMMRRVLGDEITAAIDIFSFGVTAIEFITGTMPKLDMPDERRNPITRAIERISEIERRAAHLALVQDANPAKALILRCLAMDPADRPSARECADAL